MTEFLKGRRAFRLALSFCAGCRLSSFLTVVCPPLLGCEPELVVKALQVDVEAASASEAASAAGDSTSGLLSAFLSGQGRALSLCLIPKTELAGTRSFVIDFAAPLAARLVAAWLSLVLLFATSCLLLNSAHALSALLLLFYVRTHHC